MGCYLLWFVDLESAEELYNKRITRILTQDFPHYFAVVTRIRQETKTIGPESGMLSSTVVPQVQAVFPEGSLTKKIKVGLQVSNHLLNNRLISMSVHGKPGKHCQRSIKRAVPKIYVKNGGLGVDKIKLWMA